LKINDKNRIAAICGAVSLTLGFLGKRDKGETAAAMSNSIASRCKRGFEALHALPIDSPTPFEVALFTA
jgi:hypothetical protein